MHDVWKQNLGGRPRVVTDEVRQLLIDHLNAHSNPTSRHRSVMASNQGTAVKTAIPLRTLQDTLLGTWLKSDDVRAAVSLRTFYDFCATHAPQIVQGQKRGDMCTICVTWRTVLP